MGRAVKPEHCILEALKIYFKKAKNISRRTYLGFFTFMDRDNGMQTIDKNKQIISVVPLSYFSSQVKAQNANWKQKFQLSNAHVIF